MYFPYSKEESSRFLRGKSARKMFLMRFVHLPAEKERENEQADYDEEEFRIRKEQKEEERIRLRIKI